MSDGRSLAGTSLAAETSARRFLWIQRLAPRFLESLDVARKSVFLPRSGATMGMNAKDLSFTFGGACATDSAQVMAYGAPTNGSSPHYLPRRKLGKIAGGP